MTTPKSMMSKAIKRLSNRLNECEWRLDKIDKWMWDRRDDITWHMEIAPNLGHNPKNPFPLKPVKK